MRSSGMRTTRLLTVSRSISQGDVCPSMHWAGGCVCPSMHWAGQVSASGPRGCVCDRHPPRGHTDTCENITFENFVCGR